jgi:uncharacterized protein (TIGR00255 family)
MITSMTGFASVTRESEVGSVTVTVRAVNHRFLDLQVRLPSTYGALEPTIRTLVQQRIARGRVEMQVGVQAARVPQVDVELNEAFVAALRDAVDRARASGLVSGELAPGDLLRFPQALVIREPGPDQGAPAGDGARALIEETVAAAIAGLQQMRVREGTFLSADLEARQRGLAAQIERIAAAADDGRAAVEARLLRRIEELRVEASVEPALIAQEVVRFAARSDIAEEVVRFRAHLDHWARLAAAPEPCGRKLDFLLQEMNREINTIGSKAEGTAVAELVVHAKAELERMREQVQNVE